MTIWREKTEQLLALQTKAVVDWHRRGDAFERSSTGLDKLVEDQHRCNFRIWHLEDIARDPTATDAEIANVKREIDRLNQARNDLIERIDAELLSELKTEDGWEEHAPLNSETAGSILDRCSIMALKMYHMAEEANREDASTEHRDLAARRVALLETQRRDLQLCLLDLLEESADGRRRFKVYRQLKMYNDPSLNPRIYGSSEK